MAMDIVTYLARAVVLLTSIPVHESAHGLVSYWLGDPTAKEQGRITLNPFKHFDLFGSLCMLLVGIGYAKPVPVNARYYKRPKLGMALTAAAGPVSNVLMATIAWSIYKFLYYYTFFRGENATLGFILLLLQTMAITNIVLAVFNLMPFPPFDGSRIWLVFLPQAWYFGVMKYERYIMGAVFALVYFGVLDTPLEFLYSGCLSLLDSATAFVDVIALWIFGS